MTKQHKKTTSHSIHSGYENARKIMEGFLTKKAVTNTNVYPVWVDENDCFWYSRDLESGKEFRLVDPKSGKNEPAFEHMKLASALAEVSKEKVDVNNLPFSCIEVELEPRLIRFAAFKKRWQYIERQDSCEEIGLLVEKDEILSPDGKLLAFSKDYNLWLRELKTGKEKQLTKDGEQYFAYGAPGTAWGSSLGCGLQIRWSPDSRRIFTVQRDTRQVKALPVVHHVPLDGHIRPQVTFCKFAYPGEEHVETLRLLTIDVWTGVQQPANYSQIPVTRNGFGFFAANLGWWDKDSRTAYFVDVDRYYKYARVVEFDTGTGKTKILFEEKSDTQINLMNNGDMWPSYVPLPETNELLWYSERTGWAHLYLYDLNTGKLKNRVTEGDWLVRDVVTVIAKSREVFLQTAGRLSDRNPYYRDLVRVDIDTGELFTVASSDHDYFAGAFTDMVGSMIGQTRRELEKRGTSPSGNYSVVTRSRVDTLPESVVLNRDGEELMLLETADLSGMPADWLPPEPVKVLSADNKTDIYGVIYRPSSFSPDKSYPVISDVLNTPDFPYAPIGAFDNNIFNGMGFFTAASIAELGFIVVQLDGRGGGFRNKVFKDVGYGNLQLSCMQEDQVAGIKQLAERYPFMDLSKVGIREFSGGPAVINGMLDFPEFYKVGVSTMPHDARLMAASMWGDMFEGKFRNEQAFPEDKIRNLKGRLLLIAGMLDVAAPPATVFRVVEALQSANKDFDMLLLPNFDHEVSGYLVRRSWDYLVQNLMGEEPPKEFQLTGLLGNE